MKRRKVTKEIIIHCSATPEGKDYTVEDIRRWHLKRGFKDIGYHFVIYRDGSIHVGRAKDLVGAHCEGHNAISIGVCYIGGMARPLTPGPSVAIGDIAPLCGGTLTFSQAAISPVAPEGEERYREHGSGAEKEAKKKHTTMIGGKEYIAADTRTPEQKDSMRALIGQLVEEYTYTDKDGVVHKPTIHGHNEFARKACPGFRVPDEL